MLKTKYFAGCIIVVTSMLLSCKKNVSSYDIMGETGIKFFINNNPAPGNAPDNSINYNLVNIPDQAGSGLINLSSSIPDTIQFPVFATRAVTQDVTIEAAQDDSLITAYNTVHNTHYAAFPAGVLNTNGLVAHIHSGSTTSADSIQIITDDSKLNLLTNVAYMAPIKLTTVSNSVVGQVTSTTTNVTYIVANIEQRRINYNAVAASALGALISPRTSWALSFTPALATSGSIIDGSTSTYARWAASPGQVDLDMQASKNVTGIRLYNSSSATYAPTQAFVYLSNDGINYDLIGAPLKANITSASGYNYILFYKSISARYIRLILNYSTSTSSNNFRIAEFDVYSN